MCILSDNVSIVDSHIVSVCKNMGSIVLEIIQILLFIIVVLYSAIDHFSDKFSILNFH